MKCYDSTYSERIYPVNGANWPASGNYDNSYDAEDEVYDYKENSY